MASPETKLAKNDKNLAWIDLEMTGPTVEKERIIEIAVVVTSPDLQIRIKGPTFAIKQSDEFLAGMDSWNTNTHTKSGLVDRVKTSLIDEGFAETETIDFLGLYVSEGKALMCGNCLGLDRLFLARYMPKLAAFFSHKGIDVDSFTQLARIERPELVEGFRRSFAHSAMADIFEAIYVLEYYKKYLIRT